jgi:hypothetical protein
MPEKVQKQGRGCLFYGVITMILVIIGVAAGIYFGARKAILTAVANYTSATPAPIPQLRISDAEKDRIARQLALQARQVTQGQGPKELALGEQELNVLLSQSPELRAYSNQIYLQPEGDKLKAHLSLPLDQFEHWKSLSRKISGDLHNRYLNGTAFLNVGVTNGTLSLSLADLVVNGKTLPQEFTSRIQSQNFAAAANTNAEAQAVLQRVEAITVQDGKVQVRFKR